MNWEAISAIGAIGELLGAGGVIVSLIYVAAQQGFSLTWPREG